MLCRIHWVLSEEGSLILKLDIFSVHVLNYLGKSQKKHESPHFPSLIPNHKSHIKKKASFEVKRDLLAALQSLVSYVVECIGRASPLSPPRFSHCPRRHFCQGQF